MTPADAARNAAADLIEQHRATILPAMTTRLKAIVDETDGPGPDSVLDPIAKAMIDGLAPVALDALIDALRVEAA